MATLATRPALTAVPPLPAVRARALRAVAPAATWLAVQALAVGVLAAMAALHGHTLQLHPWDGDWYLQIARHGYTPAAGGLVDAYNRSYVWTSLAFFPGYPLLVSAMAPLFGWHYLPAAVAASVLAGVVAAFGMARLTRHLTGTRRAPLVAVTLMAAMPLAVLGSLAYPVTLVLAGSLWALVGLVERRWAVAALGAVVAGATEPEGLPSVAVVMIGALVAIHAGDGPRRGPFLALFAAPAGMYAYLLFVAQRTGDLLGWFRVQQQGWGSRFDVGVSTGRFVFDSLTTGREAFPVITSLIVVAAVALLAWTRSRLPWLVWTYGLLLVALTLGSGGLVVWDKARLLLPVAPLLIPVAVLLAGRRGWGLVWPLAGFVAFGVWFSAYALTVWPYSI